MAAAGEEVVLIGLCDGEADPQKYPSSWSTNKIGGSPDVYPGASRLSPDCSLCGAPLVHVVQVYGPLEGSPYHRTLQLFACAGPACSGQPRAWRLFRSQALETEVNPAGSRSVGPGLVHPLPLATDWCDAADDWGVEEGDGGMEEGDGGVSTHEAPLHVVEETPVLLPLTSEVDVGLQRLSLRGDDPEEPRGDAPVLRGFFISVVEESELRGEADGMEHAQRLLREYESREGVSAGSTGAPGGEVVSSSGEKYEKSRARHGDEAFRRFMKRVSLCPEQVLRYSWGGEPLFLSDPPSDMAHIVPACGSCGGRRTFELQLMPALVSLLHTCRGSTLEFGTVLVFTCRGSCWTPPGSGGSPREEFVFLQEDPDQQLFT
ncbi:hypothetical protein NHX12_003517 [Muraenolepis orangiensis]|uniref:Programmed cell death protein 2 C-terminal domain-containing protein n=1 Tax=Muraenolepis orangiensis TaxID=630683 RepID=A0A9Q0IE80_9TELE|nr:hypothetical protein NHX12_003517 [Muraenolepis orangiensis]